MPKISQLPEKTIAQGIDYVPIVDVSGVPSTKKMTLNKLIESATGPTGPQGPQGVPGNDGANGTNGTDGEDAFVYIAYASDASGTGFTMTFNSSLDYIAVLSTTTAIPSPSASDFTGLWKKYKGEIGADGPQGPQGIQGIQGIQGEQGISTGQNIWFHDNASDIATYQTLKIIPADATENDDTASVNSGSGEVLVEAYATDAGYPGVSAIPTGTWRFLMWHYVSAATAVTTFVYRVYKRIVAGTETEIFNVETAEINATSVTSVDTSYTLTSVYTLDPTDRIVIKVFAKTTAVPSITAHFVHEGTTHASYVVSSLGVSTIVGPTGPQGPQGDPGQGVPTGGTTGQVLKKDSNADYDTSFGDLVAVSVTTKGDLQTHDGSNPTRLGVGANGKVLQADSTQTNGIKWGDLTTTSLVKNEVPGGAINSSNTAFTTAAAFQTDSLRVYQNGIRLKGGGVDFTEGSSAFTMVTAPTTGDIMLVDYDTNTSVYATGSTSFIYNEVPSGTVNGSNAAFDTAHTYVAGTIQVYRDGQLMTGGGADYTETDSNTITFTTAPVTGSVILVTYQSDVSTAGNADTLDGQHAPTGTIVGTSDTQTLTSKTLTSPIISGTGGTSAGQHGYDTTDKGIYIGDGTAKQEIFTSAWKSFTPTIAGAVSAIGNATLECAYTQVGKLVVARYRVIFGNTTSFTAGTLTITPPVTGANFVQGAIGSCYILDNAVQGYQGQFYFNSTTQFLIGVGQADATYLKWTAVTNTVPFTFGTSDGFLGVISYEAA